MGKITVKDLLGKYKDEVVPLLDAKEYELAGHELFNLCYAFDSTVKDLENRGMTNQWVYSLQLNLRALQTGCLNDETGEGAIDLLRKNVDNRTKFIEPYLDRLV